MSSALHSTQVKSDYKRTDAGLIPEDWDAMKLGNFISLQRGHDLTWRERRKGSVPVMGSAGQNGFHDTALAKGPGVVLGRSGASFGQAHYCEQDFWPHNTALYVTDFRGNDPLFTFYFLSSIDFSRHNSGGAQQSLNRNFISPISIGVPRPSEQRIIAEALSDVDALLDGLDRLIAKKRDLKQAAVQQLLTGQTRLPGFHDEWKLKRLGDVAEIVMGQSPSSSNYNTTGMGLPLIQGNADIDNRKTIKRIFTTQITKRGKSGDILMSVRAPVGEISRAVFDVCLGRGVCAIRYDNDFMYHCLINLEPAWAKHSKGSTFDSVNSADVKALQLYMPTDTDEQTAVADVLTEMDAELAALEQRREKTRALKEATMEELLTGKTRLI
jgi:type I restriction enzyme, S subunit